MNISSSQVAHAAREIREVEAALRLLAPTSTASSTGTDSDSDTDTDAELVEREWHELVCNRLRLAAIKLEAVNLTNL